MITAKGTVTTVTYYNQENGFTVARLAVESAEGMPKPRHGTLTIVGDMPELSAGDALEVTGELVHHATYGDQLRVQSWGFDVPATRTGVKRFLGSGLFKGIGKETANKIVKAWGTEALDILDRNPERLAEIPGLGTAKIRTISASWHEQKSLRNLMFYLQELGVTPGLGRRIHEEMGHESIPRLRENPYLLCKMEGIGFKRADALAAKAGILNDKFERVEAAILHVIQQSLNEGHSFLPGQVLLERTHELTQVATDRIWEHLHRMLSMESVVATLAPGQERFVQPWTVTQIYDPVPTPNPNTESPSPIPPTTKTEVRQAQPDMEELAIYLPWVYQCESGLAQNLKDLLDRTTELSHRARTWTWEEFFQQNENEMPLSTQQQEAVQAVMHHPFSVLTGGPGTGKTTTIRTIISLCKEQNLHVNLAAPTGRAAKRMQEATGMPASTIHRLLEVSVQAGMEFSRDERNPLEGDLLIVDEASMLDVHIAYFLSKAIPAHMHVLLVGDVDQLPSVGVGNVLRDIIHVIESRSAGHSASAGICPIVRLDVIFRQGADSAIVENAHRIRRGHEPIIDNQTFRDFYFMSHDDPQKAHDTILSLLAQRLPSYFDLKVQDIMVLCPMRRGAVGVDNLNESLQRVLNPPGTNEPELHRGGMVLRKGDLVMQIRNDYQKMVFNGDLGTLVNVDPQNKGAQIRFDDVTHDYDQSDLGNITLAYAITVHKSQGSEYPAVVIPLMRSHSIMLQRNLLYTAMTRAKQLVVIVGERAALRQAVRNARVSQRYSALYETVQSLLEGVTEPNRSYQKTLTASG